MRPEGAQVERARERCVQKVLKLSSEVSECKPLAPGGFGERGVEGKILTAKYARENKVWQCRLTL
jgi:CTP synthase (UTP-ammonia lyase)